MIRIAALLLLLSGLGRTQEVPAPGSRGAFTFTEYELRAQVAPAQGTLAVRGRIRLRNDSGQPQSAAVLQVSFSLRWASVRSQDEPLEMVTDRVATGIDHSGAVNEAVVRLPRPVAPGESVELGVAYSGRIPADATRLESLGMPAETARRSDWDRIAKEYTAVRGVGYVAWYPVSLPAVSLEKGNEVFAAVAEWRGRHSETAFRATFDRPGAGELLCNGQRSEERDTITCRFARLGLEAPLFVIGDLAALENANGRVWYLPGSRETATQYAGVLAKWRPAFTAAIARKAEFVQLPEGWANHESGAMLLAPLRRASEAELALSMVHTLTHAAVTSPRAWIEEGLAHFAQARAIEAEGGRARALAFLEQRRAALALAESGGGGQELIRATDEIYYRTKAMYVWWMLRDMLGDAAVEKAVAQYHPEQDKEPSTMQRLLEAASGKDLEGFFDDWVYRDRGLPEFRVTAVYPRQNLRGGYLVTVTVENTGRAGAEVPVLVKTRATEASARVYVGAESQATIRIDVPLAPVEVMVNDGSVPETDTSDNSFAVSGPK
jgi:hypothetical protein